MLLAVLGLAGPLAASAHIGNPTTIYEGMAGPAPVRVSIRVPSVVPGLAEINVRVFTNGVTRVTALPIFGRAGLNGSPPPDVCKPVAGEANLFHAQLWLMARGAYSVNVTVDSVHGSGKVIVPINSLATTRLPLPNYLGVLLALIGLFLFALAVTAVGAALRESVLEPGATPSTRRVWAGRAGVAGAALALALALYGGWQWWQSVDLDYRNNRMHKPIPALADVRTEAAQRVLRLTVLTTNEPRSGSPGWSSLVPDHGKLMHLFLVREPGMDAFAHLHPLRRGMNAFESALPPLPPGRYGVYADVTHETGFSQTLTATAELPGDNAATPARLSDADDSWFVGQQAGTVGRLSCALGDGFTMHWDRPNSLLTANEATLRFRVLGASGAPAELDPYMSMLSHAIVRRDDGSVFTHLHPAGSISVASQQVFQLRSGDKPPRRITPEMMENLCQAPSPELRRLPIAFPYEFPKPGRYRIWVQVKTDGKVRTGVFDAEVLAGAIGGGGGAGF
ncbi:MAG TPA: hypothetical protein VFT34_01455 [Verrucomicrobiae bacterium]|nr:hypothetical protein [Verrucomicrobiae bacterium]